MEAEIQINPKPYKWLKESTKRFNYLYGGSSSGKSWTMAQFLIIERWGQKQKRGILVVRKTRPAVKTSCWELVLGELHKLGFVEDKHYTVNKSDLIIRHNNGNFFMFDGMDNVYKKKSIEGINTVWVEEAAGMMHDAIITEKEFTILDINCRADYEGSAKQLFCTFNPVDPLGNKWLKDRTDGIDVDADDSQIMTLNHNENPFIKPEEHHRIEVLADKDPELDKIYRQGLWAMPRFIIYERWDTCDDMPEKYSRRLWGLDFGYSADQAALVEIRFCGDDVYERELIYQTNLTNQQLIHLMKQIIGDSYDEIIADCAEPKSIQDIRNAGFNIHPCFKGKASVRYGIQAVKSCNVHICKGSVNLIKEKQAYKWKADKDENPLPEPVDWMNHLMDAERYAISRVKGKVVAGISILGEEEKPVVIPTTRDEMIASRYVPVERRPPETDGEDYDEEDAWDGY